jgi:EpsI family protein
MPNILKSWPARIATLILLGQAALLYSSVHPEEIPKSTPLVEIPRSLGMWQQAGSDGLVEPEVLDILKADDLLNRTYADTTGAQANLFIAAFRSQRNGKAPHSPKNCLPGSGWAAMEEGVTSIDVNENAPIIVNRYVVGLGEQHSLVLYWYQSRGRVVASEYKAKFWVVADAMRYNRTDTALVRVIVGISNRDEASAERTGVAFVKTFFPAIRQILPR